MADVLFTSQALDATARLLLMFAVTATAKLRVAKAKGNVCETPLPLTTPHCSYANGYISKFRCAMYIDKC